MGAGNSTRAEGANLFAMAQHCVQLSDPESKCAATVQAAAAIAAHETIMTNLSERALPIGLPGRPPRPRLVSPRDVPRRGLGTLEGRVALIHAVAHIEFNAINLAWDAVYRFRDMPDDYYRDWVGVAVDEARHFSLLQVRLAELGHAYGDFDAHDGLWEMAVKTADSCLSRMALVPRVLEARGLDVTPGMITRLRAVGDLRSVEILETILSEEIAHVAAGSRWFAWCCVREGCDPDATFSALIDRYAPGALKGPFNTGARLAAGFSSAEMAHIEALA